MYMSFKIDSKALAEFESKTCNVINTRVYTAAECPGGSCGNNCSGTCATSPCTNLCAATTH